MPNRRAFLRGAAGAAVALPFLESIPERSPWAAGSKPIFAFFICTVGGVVRSKFFPAATGALTQAGLAAAGKATSALAAHADNLLLLSGINWPPGSSRGDSHVDGLCVALTGKLPQEVQDVTKVTAGGPSADSFIAGKVHPGKAPIALYAGNVRNGYEAQRLSFAGPGQLNPVIDNPYNLYRELMGLTGAVRRPDRSAVAPEPQERPRPGARRPEVADAAPAIERRRSAAPAAALRRHSRRREHHDRGVLDGRARPDHARGAETWKYNAHRTDEMVRLHMSLVAMAFACNHRRAASLQWGDPYDFTVYDVPSNNDRQWKFNFISHRVQSDSAIGSDASDPLAAQAHAEIDVVRMQTLAAGLDHFKARGLADQCFVMWTNNYAEGPSHSFVNVPHIIWGSGGGF